MTRGEETAPVATQDTEIAAADGSMPLSASPPDQCVHGYEYAHFQELAHNLPYVVMTLVGTALFYFGSLDSSWAWAWATGYFAYAFLATLSFIVLLCPYCRYYDTRQCPCGYGQIAAKLRSRKEAAGFGKRFLRQVLVILPLWIAPPVVAGIALYVSFDWLITALLALFAVDSFVLLPVVAARYGCANCPQKEDWLPLSIIAATRLAGPMRPVRVSGPHTIVWAASAAPPPAAHPRTSSGAALARREDS